MLTGHAVAHRFRHELTERVELSLLELREVRADDVDSIIVNPNIPSQVFAGMDWGLYYTDNINANPPVWQRFEGLPHVMIWSLSIDRGFTTLAAYTRSRGAWAWPLPVPAGGDADLAARAHFSLRCASHSKISCRNLREQKVNCKGSWALLLPPPRLLEK
jgi:hypothetical protein